MKQEKLSAQAEYIKKEFPTISDENINMIDLKMKERINELKTEVEVEEVQKYFLETIKEYDKSKNISKIKHKVCKLTEIYLDNNKKFGMQREWYGVLAYFLSVIGMIQNVLGLKDIIINKISFVMYLLALCIWLLIVWSERCMGENAENVINKFNAVAGELAIGELLIYYAVAVFTANMFIRLLVILFMVLTVVWLTVLALKREKIFKKEKMRNTNAIRK